MALATPRTVDDFKKVRKSFEAWLLARGSAVMAATNEYEVIRFTSATNTCVVYRNAAGNISNWANGALEAWNAYQQGKEWRGTKRGKRRRHERIIQSLAARDGWACLYCRDGLDEESATIEHAIPITAGGNSHMSNLALACEPCNRAVGHMAVAEKIRFAVKQQRARRPIAAVIAPIVERCGAGNERTET